MKIIRAQHLGMCFGVRDAITMAELNSESAPLTILGDLVHNETVLDRLRQRGIQLESDLESVRTRNVMITAHGTSEKALEAVKSRGFNVVEATCPLVRFAHQSTHQLARAGFHIIVIGRRDHVEVRGLTGDLDEFDVVMNEEEINKLAKRPRFGVTAQTTQPIDKVKRIVAALRQRFPESEVRFIDTVCQPTKLRQRAAIELAQCADVVVVIGGASSNNTKELVATCRSHCSRVYHVQDADEIDASWIVGADVIGITAGTSTPASSIEAVESRLHQLARSVSRCHGLVPA